MEIIFWVMSACLLLVLLGRGRAAGLAPYAVATGLFVIFLALISQAPVDTASPKLMSWTWSKHFGASFSFKLDGLAMVMAILISFIGTGVFLYSASYMKSHSGLGKFYATLTVFTSAMIGLVLADNMILFFLFWEATSVCSFLLVGTKHQKAVARESARRALFITVSGGLLLLTAFLMISAHGQSMGLSLSDSMRFSLIDRSIVWHPYFPAIVLLVAAGIASKSAQVPFHIWLPSAMAGPTPVSSFLHSATMVKAGIFLLARLSPHLGGNDLWNTTFTAMGATTMIAGAIMSASQRDIKKILAYSTISVLGILVLLFGMGSDVAIKAAVVFLVAHALYKAALFQIIGNIDFATGNRDLKTLGSLARYMPVTATAAVLSALSMAGAPPLFGFFGKELAYLAKLQLGAGGLILIPLAVLTNILLVGLALSICSRPFWSKNTNGNGIKKVPLMMSIVPLTLSICGLFIGVFPRVFDTFLGTQMATAVAGETLLMKLKLWHGINLESLLVITLSVVTLAVGIFVAAKVKPIISFFSYRLGRVQKYTPDAIYELVITNIPKLATKVTSFLQSGDLSKYIAWTLSAAFFMLTLPLIKAINVTGLVFDFQWIEMSMFLIISLPAIAALIIKNNLIRLILLGASGFGMVLSFMISGAPDLALTQLLVEALVLIFVILLFRYAFKNTGHGGQRSKTGSLILSFGFSVYITLLLSVRIPEVVNSTKDFFLENSHVSAFGKNVVNVILVDFRALDTFGEVVVVAIAALGCGAILLTATRSKQNG